MGWLMFKLKPLPPFDNVADLRKDPLVAWQHRYIHLIAVLVAFVLQASIEFVWVAGKRPCICLAQLRPRGQSFCSAHISAASRVISAGSRSVLRSAGNDREFSLAAEEIKQSTPRTDGARVVFN
jgi:hypothetical protein